MLARIVILVFLFCSGAGLTGAEERGDPATGLSYAKQACATCHAVREGDSIYPTHSRRVSTLSQIQRALAL